MKVVLRGYILVSPGDLETVREHLDEHVRLTHAEAGCLKFAVTPDESDPNRFNVYEEFVDAAAFELHQARIRDSAWGRVTANVERHYEVEGLEE